MLQNTLEIILAKAKIISSPTSNQANDSSSIFDEYQSVCCRDQHQPFQPKNKEILLGLSNNGLNFMAS